MMFSSLRRAFVLVAVAAGATLWIGGALAAEDRSTFDAVFKAYSEAYDKRDLKAIGESWTADAVYIDLGTGRRVEGRESIVRNFEGIFKSRPKARVRIKLERVRQPAEKTALAEGTVTVTEGSNEESTSFSALLVFRDGRWRMDSVQESDTPAPGEPAEGLKDIGWLLGTWKDQVEGRGITSEFRWAPGGAFIVRSYSSGSGDLDTQGTQVIGWDPTDGTIRSWTFDSDGSFGQESWERISDGWRIRVRRVLPGGETALGTQIITPVDKDTFKARWLSGEVGGRMIPSSETIVVKRVSATADAKKK